MCSKSLIWWSISIFYKAWSWLSQEKPFTHAMTPCIKSVMAISNIALSLRLIWTKNKIAIHFNPQHRCFTSPFLPDSGNKNSSVSLQKSMGYNRLRKGKQTLSEGLRYVLEETIALGEVQKQTEHILYTWTKQDDMHRSHGNWRRVFCEECSLWSSTLA